MTVALSVLCENPRRRTGLSTFFSALVQHSLRLFPDVHWIVFAGKNYPWRVIDPRVQLVDKFRLAHRTGARLISDHFVVPILARRMNADALVTVGFVPLRKCLPVATHVLALHHMDAANRVTFFRAQYRGLMLRRALLKADLLITNSQCASDEILSVDPTCRPRLLTSYEGLDIGEFQPQGEADEAIGLREALNINPGYLLWVSNLYPYKQADLAIAAYARLPRGLRESHPLLVVGGNWQGTLELLKTQVSQLGLGDHVYFAGWVEDRILPVLYRNAAAFCMSSRSETFGRSVVEAMACGTPCIVNDIPIMREVTGGHAVFSRFEDSDRTSRDLEAILSDEALRRTLRIEGVRQTSRFSFEKLATERVTAILRMVQPQPLSPA